jgi:RHS repeat-associated protein
MIDSSFVMQIQFEVDNHQMPTGELFAEQRDHWATQYKFNGKELDEETGLYYYGARYYTPEIGIWLSVDPLSDKYPSMSAFMYCAGNPVVLVDPDGREIYITGDAAGEAFGQLQNKTKLKLTIDNKGKVEAKGIAWTKKDRMIKKASKDKDVRVNIEANNSESFEGWDGKEREYENNIGGAYGGSVVSDDGKIDSYQYVNPSRLGTMDKDVGDEKTGGYMLHEVAEGYYSGILGMKTKGDKIVGGSNYDEAHRRANKISGGGYLHIEERGKFPAFFFKNNIPLNYHTGITNDRKVGDKYKRTKE